MTKKFDWKPPRTVAGFVSGMMHPLAWLPSLVLAFAVAANIAQDIHQWFQCGEDRVTVLSLLHTALVVGTACMLVWAGLSLLFTAIWLGTVTTIILPLYREAMKARARAGVRIHEMRQKPFREILSFGQSARTASGINLTKPESDPPVVSEEARLQAERERWEEQQRVLSKAITDGVRKYWMRGIKSRQEVPVIGFLLRLSIRDLTMPLVVLGAGAVTHTLGLAFAGQNACNVSAKAQAISASWSILLAFSAMIGSGIALNRYKARERLVRWYNCWVAAKILGTTPECVAFCIDNPKDVNSKKFIVQGYGDIEVKPHPRSARWKWSRNVLDITRAEYKALEEAGVQTWVDHVFEYCEANTQFMQDEFGALQDPDFEISTTRPYVGYLNFRLRFTEPLTLATMGQDKDVSFDIGLDNFRRVSDEYNVVPSFDSHGNSMAAYGLETMFSNLLARGNIKNTNVSTRDAMTHLIRSYKLMRKHCVVNVMATHTRLEYLPFEAPA